MGWYKNQQARYEAKKAEQPHETLRDRRTRVDAQKSARAAYRAAVRDAKPAGQPAPSTHGRSRPEIVCPQCQTKGSVSVESVKRKTGIHGGKATAALFTGGVSLLATGLSGHRATTRAHCNNCKSTWEF